MNDFAEVPLSVSETGVLTFKGKCCVYPAVDGTISAVTQNENGTYDVKISHTDDFYGIISGLNAVYYETGSAVYANIPVGYTRGESDVQVTMYAGGEMLTALPWTKKTVWYGRKSKTNAPAKATLAAGGGSVPRSPSFFAGGRVRVFQPLAAAVPRRGAGGAGTRMRAFSGGGEAGLLFEPRGADAVRRRDYGKSGTAFRLKTKSAWLPRGRCAIYARRCFSRRCGGCFRIRTRIPIRRFIFRCLSARAICCRFIRWTAGAF